jgi:hypothetical protein
LYLYYIHHYNYLELVLFSLEIVLQSYTNKKRILVFFTYTRSMVWHQLNPN